MITGTGLPATLRQDRLDNGVIVSTARLESGGWISEVAHEDEPWRELDGILRRSERGARAAHLHLCRVWRLIG